MCLSSKSPIGTSVTSSRDSVIPILLVWAFEAALMRSRVDGRGLRVDKARWRLSEVGGGWGSVGAGYSCSVLPLWLGVRLTLCSQVLHAAASDGVHAAPVADVWLRRC